MVLWRSELRTSLLARRLSLLLHGLVALALLLTTWQAGLTAFCLPLVVFECRRSQRRIRQREGEIALLTDGQLQWRQKDWCLCGRPWMTQQAMLLSLRSANSEREKLWLLRDSMDEAEWRQLRQQLMTAE